MKRHPQLFFPTACLLLLGGAAYSHMAGAACDPRAVVQSYISGDYTSATRRNNECLDHYGLQTADIDEAGTGRDWFNALLRLYHLCTGSQIAAEAGRLLEAGDLLERARGSGSYLLGNPLVDWASVIKLTEGYYLEMSGDRYAARQYYQGNLESHGAARLAVMALQDGDTSAAIDAASQALAYDPLDLTALIVMASISDGADGTVSELLRPILENRQNTNQFMPAYYAEVWWARIWLEEAGKIGAMPVQD